MAPSWSELLAGTGLEEVAARLEDEPLEDSLESAAAQRVSFLARLKHLGIDRLPDRQKLANLCARTYRQGRVTGGELAVGAAAAPSHVISLERRADRRGDFLSRWRGHSPPRWHAAVDGQDLIKRRGAPSPPPAARSDGRTAALRADWRASVSASLLRDIDADRQPRKLAAVVGCHCSHLDLWELVAAAPADEPHFIFEDDATWHVDDLRDWFARHVAPLLPEDWAMVFLNEPLGMADGGDGQGLAARAAAAADGAGWRAVCAADTSHPFARCLIEMRGPPTTEGYVLRRAAAEVLIEYTLSGGYREADREAGRGGFRAADYAIAEALALSPEMSRRTFLVDPPVVCQPPAKFDDSDIQNFVQLRGSEVHMRDRREVMLALRAAAGGARPAAR